MARDVIIGLAKKGRLMQPTKDVEVRITRRYRQVEKVCPVCGEGFIGSPLRTYCSDRCSKRAGWERNSEKYNANRRAARKNSGKPCGNTGEETRG